jgi:hypothetical protein
MKFRILAAGAFVLVAGAAMAQGERPAASGDVDHTAAIAAGEPKRGEADGSASAPKSVPERKVRVIVPSPYGSSGAD